MKNWLITAAAFMVAYQLFVPPVIGLADQSDFKRMIGRFGYGPQQPENLVDFVRPKYVPDSSYRVRDWEQFSSEYLFVGSALFVNKVVSKDGSLDIRVMGLVHALAFLAIFARLLYVTRRLPARAFIWIFALLITTDVAHVAYFNSFYAEPASFLFCLLLLAESIEVFGQAGISTAQLVRWACCAALFVLAKPLNAPLGALLVVFVLRFGPLRRVAWAACIILAAAAFEVATTPPELKDANTYNLVFLSILPESRHPATDIRALGLAAEMENYSRTGPWSPNTGFWGLKKNRIIPDRLNLLSVVRFYVLRPTRLWRHIQASLPIATRLCPDLGNFERSAGFAPKATSQAFAIWSGFHETILLPAAKLLFFALPVPAFVVLIRRLWGRSVPRTLEGFALLGIACLTAFLTAIFGDSWDTVKHLFLFNLLLDAYLCSAVVLGWSRVAVFVRSKHQPVAVPEAVGAFIAPPRWRRAPQAAGSFTPADSPAAGAS